jgi:hypothetical protein
MGSVALYCFDKYLYAVTWCPKTYVVQIPLGLCIATTTVAGTTGWHLLLLVCPHGAVAQE